MSFAKTLRSFLFNMLIYVRVTAAVNCENKRQKDINNGEITSRVTRKIYSQMERSIITSNSDC